MSNKNVKELNEFKKEGYEIFDMDFELSEKVERVNIMLKKDTETKEMIVENDSDFIKYMLFHDLKPKNNGNTGFVYISDPNSYTKHKIKFVNYYTEVNKLIDNKIPLNNPFLLTENLFDLLYNFLNNKQIDKKSKKVNTEFSDLYNKYKEIYHYFAWDYHIELNELKKMKPLKRKRNIFEVYFDTTRILLNDTFIKPLQTTNGSFPKEIFKTFNRYYKMSPIRFKFMNFYKDTVKRINKQKKLLEKDNTILGENLIEEYSSLYELSGKLINFIRFMHEFSNSIENPSFYLTNDKNIKYLENTEFKPLIQCLKPKLRNPRYHIEYEISEDNKTLIVYDSRPGIRKTIDEISFKELVSLNLQTQILIKGIMLSIIYFETKIIFALLTSPQYILKLQELESLANNLEKNENNFSNRAEDGKMGDGILPPQARNG